MALADFQAALGCMVQAAPGATPHVHLSSAEQASLERLEPSAGLRLTAAVQRSWREGRAARAARLTLSALPIADRQLLLERWIECGGGTSSFFAAEAEAFLTFIEPHLPGRSHLRTLCQLERDDPRRRGAAGAAVSSWTGGCFASIERRLSAAPLWGERYADLVEFWAFVGAHPCHTARPSCAGHLGNNQYCSPWHRGYCRPASDEEAALWPCLIEPVPLAAVLTRGVSPRTIRALVREGALRLPTTY